MNWIKKILGFNSPHSWVKWLRLAFAAVALIIATAFWGNFAPMVMEDGIIGLIFALILFIVAFGPILAIMLGVASLIGLLVGGMLSGVKQRQSFRETIATGSPQLLELEKLRLKSQALDLLFPITAIILFSLGFVFLEDLYGDFGEAGFYGFMLLAGLALLGFWLAKTSVKLRYKRMFKELIVTGELEAVLDNLDFQPEAKLDEALVKAAALFPHYDIYYGNDYLAADYHGRHFIQSDIHLQEEREETYRDDDGELQTRTIYVSVFRGRLMIFDYDAISNEPVTVCDRHGGRMKSTEAIQTELDAFNRRFYVSAPSPTAALRILTPPVLESILMASDKLGCLLYLSFREDKLYVALSCGDMFEAAGGDATLSEQRRRVTGDIKAMLDLIDTLYLKDQPHASKKDEEDGQ
ncbi:MULTISPECIES: DUF3137 domain-containing protein [Sporomusa]|uniref:DUF3137 domain-containing protein n=1 Tax=Sporomusa TaxID=2375 RepID=UPI0016695535|nr:MULTISPECIES: DUF3137 domain-containing protein [Sporomusa]MCM0761241.1 DUF3137 domain-containing protein [Sporomusa sphaeroides DSM 2875]